MSAHSFTTMVLIAEVEINKVVVDVDVVLVVVSHPLHVLSHP